MEIEMSSSLYIVLKSLTKLTYTMSKTNLEMLSLATSTCSQAHLNRMRQQKFIISIIFRMQKQFSKKMKLLCDLFFFHGWAFNNLFSCSSQSTFEFLEHFAVLSVDKLFIDGFDCAFNGFEEKCNIWDIVAGEWLVGKELG